MNKSKRPCVELRYYEPPAGEPVFALWGASWKRNYRNATGYVHFHNLMEIGLCYYGSGEIQCGADFYAYRDGTFTVIPANVPHETTSETTTQTDFWEYVFCDAESLLEEYFGQDLFAKTQMLYRITTAPRVYDRRQHPRIVQLIRLLLEEFKRPANSYSHDFVKSITLALLFRIADLGETDLSPQGDWKKNRDELRISLALDYVEQHYAEPVRICQLADACHISETHFRALFEKAVNMKPLEYLQFRRIKHACDKMLNTDNNMETIATLCGFSSQSSFNRAFQKYLGTTPYQWKQAHRSSGNLLMDYHITLKEGWT